MIESLRLRVDQISQHLGKSERFQVESVSESIENLVSQTDAIGVSKSWDEIVARYNRLKSLLETVNVQRYLIASRSKAQTVLDNKPFLVASQKQLERIQALRHYLNFEPLHDLASKAKRLRKLELSAVALSSLATQKREKVDALLQEYNETVMQVSRRLTGDS
mmetsp:Transcript_8755/g.17089  ORF Transcript_8755/g.17089 Transcript_8755/m.17089 type:complete len:163 (-) Transcript_8755:1342-1830(-)